MCSWDMANIFSRDFLKELSSLGKILVHIVMLEEKYTMGCLII